ncbi:MAG: hypothetical protein GXO64_00730 [Candidatus Micrarchaeota archaeon]|nr:hypothetical protein [Candidatus Micrarchaeota archaeon]
MEKVLITSVFVALMGVAVIFTFLISAHPMDFETKRGMMIEHLHEEIEYAESEGNYDCCIEPACTMCYLGSWIWDDGKCRCDDMIELGEDDKVCPECKKGSHEQSCSSGNDSVCDFTQAE